MDNMDGFYIELEVVINDLKDRVEEITPDQVPRILEAASVKDLKELE